MYPILVQVCGLIGLLVFMKEIWNEAPLEKAAFVSAGAALAVYGVLLLIDISVRRIIEYTPPRLAEDPSGGSASAESPAPSRPATDAADRSGAAAA